MTAHTPGPWDAYETAGHDRHGQSAVYDQNGKDIAIVYDGDANARLIAAAPELLEACQRSLDTMQWALAQKQPKPGTTDPCVMACQDLQYRIGTAIRKATGGSI